MGIDDGTLQGIVVNISFGGEAKNHFRAVLEKWKSRSSSTFNWCTVLNILTSPTIDEKKLAENIVKKLRKKNEVAGTYLTIVYPLILIKIH